MLGTSGQGDPQFETSHCSIYVVVEDPDALHDRAKAAGAEITRELQDMDYGSTASSPPGTARRRVPGPRRAPARVRAGRGRAVIRVVLADDQALVRAGFRALLDAEPDIDGRRRGGDGADAVRLALQTPARRGADGHPDARPSTAWRPPGRSSPTPRRPASG